jgi:hypothetical protein
MKKLVLSAVIIIVLVLPALFATAQEAAIVPVTLEDLTANTDVYMGQTVILQGWLTDYLNINSLVVTENVPIDNDGVLVINNSGEPFPPEFFLGEEIIVTGVVHPSWDEMQANSELTPTAEATLTPDSTETPAENPAMLPIDLFPGVFLENFPEAYRIYTVIEVTDLANVGLFEETPAQ